MRLIRFRNTVHTRFTLGAAAAAAVLLGAATAASGQVQMSFGGPGGATTTPVGRSAMDRYFKILELDENQKQAALALHDAYQSASRDAAKKLRDDMAALKAEVRDEDAAISMQRVPALLSAHAERSGEASMRFLDDLRSLLTPEQIESNWPRLERYRRRAAWLRMGPVSGSAVDLISLVEKMNLPPDMGAKLAETLDRYELDIDRLLRERERFEAENAAKPGDGPPPLFDPERFQKQFAADRENGIKVRDTNQTYARQLGSMLPEAERARLAEMFQTASFKRIYRETFTAKKLKAAERLADLDESQKQRLQSLSERYAREIKAANDRLAESQARAEADGTAHAFPVVMMGATEDGTPADLKDARTARRDLDRRYSEQLAQVLTEDQQARLPKPGEGRGRGGVQTGMRFTAENNGRDGGLMIIATEENGHMIMDDDVEIEEGEDGDMIIRQVIVERHDDAPTTAPQQQQSPSPPEEKKP